MALTNVFYHLPEDNDSLQEYNTFQIYKPIQDITLIDIRTFFPLPGEYHFRFQYKYASSLVWLDLNNENSKLPQIDGMIIMKVLRKTWIMEGSVSDTATSTSGHNWHHSKTFEPVDPNSLSHQASADSEGA